MRLNGMKWVNWINGINWANGLNWVNEVIGVNRMRGVRWVLNPFNFYYVFNSLEILLCFQSTENVNQFSIY